MDKILSQKDFRAEFEKKLRQTIFPPEKIIEEVIAFSFALFNGKSLQELGISATDYKDVIHSISEEKINLYQMSFILNYLPSMSARDLGLTINEYTDLMLQVNEMAKTWNAERQPIQEKLVNEMNREAAKMDKRNGNKVNPQNRRK